VHLVALALFEGFNVLDAHGPVEAFAMSRMPTADGGFRQLFERITMAEFASAIHSGEGPAAYAA
jgi:hypothetical protein